MATHGLLTPTASQNDVKFDEPWEARAFAIVVKLADSGHFTWAEWVDCFSKEVAAATAVENSGGQPKTYYEQWLSAVEALVVEKGITTKAQLNAKKFALGAVAGTSHVLK